MTDASRDDVDRALSQRDYVDRVLREMRADIDRAAALALAAQNQQVAVELETLNRRLSELNSFRQAFSDRERDFPSREVVQGMTDTLEVKIEAVEKHADDVAEQLEIRVRAVESFVSNTRGRFWALGTALTAVVVIVNVVVYFIAHH